MSRRALSISKFLVVACAGLTVLPACPLLDVTADAQEVCLTYSNLKVPAAPDGLTDADQSFTFNDLSKIHDLTKLDANLELVRAEIRATSGISDFSFVEAAHLSVSSGDDNSTLPPVTMYDCDGNCDPNGATLEIPATDVSNVVDYLRTDSIKVDVSFKGQLPSVDWMMDVDVCFKASASYKVGS
jgi:hypothetical protein